MKCSGPLPKESKAESTARAGEVLVARHQQSKRPSLPIRHNQRVMICQAHHQENEGEKTVSCTRQDVGKNDAAARSSIPLVDRKAFGEKNEQEN
jgi:hypothetical protein